MALSSELARGLQRPKAVSSLPRLPEAPGGREVNVECGWIEAEAGARQRSPRRPLWRLPGDAVMQSNGVAAVWAPEDHSAVVAARRPALLSETMAELTARVSGGLLPFSEVTIKALGQEEAKGESGLRGKLAPGLACLSCGPQLEVLNTWTGQRGSAYRFRGMNGEPAVILAVKEFLWQKKKGLLVGLEDSEGSILCLYDISISKVVKSVEISGRVTAIEPLSNQGGPSAATENLHPSLQGLFGVAAVSTDVGQILLIDLCLDDLLCKHTGLNASFLQLTTGIPDEVLHLRERARQEGRHLGFELVGPSGTAISTLVYINRTNQLAIGFADGYVALWNMKSMTEDYNTPLKGGRTPISAMTFQEPENDPNNFCYLWAVQSTQDSQGDVLSLHLLRLSFRDKICLASGQSFYEGLSFCEESYTLDLTEGIFHLTGQTNIKFLGCQSIEKFPSQGDREEDLNEALSPDTSVSIFTWQVSTIGEEKPSVYLGIFDINSWYSAQLPDALETGEYLHNCSYFALWSLDSVISRFFPHDILHILVHERSLSRGIPPSYPPPEEFFNPTCLNFDATCLLNSGVVHINCTGFQKKNLIFSGTLGQSLNSIIPDYYNQCLAADMSPKILDIQPSNLSQQDQLEALWSAVDQTNSLAPMIRCIKRWASEHPNSATKLRFVLEWAWNKVNATKEELDRLCVPLFDGSCHIIDPQTIQSVQRCHLLLSHLNTVLNCLLAEAKRITETGIMILNNKCMFTQITCQYIQVVLWFCHFELLPEGFHDAMHLRSLCYNYPVIQEYYTSCRQKCESFSRGKWNPDYLIIDGMVSHLGNRIENLWKNDEGGTGKYPPPSLHALLDIYLLDNVTEPSKHAVTIYLLLDIMSYFPSIEDSAIESFLKVFAISYSQLRLIKGLWYIDHKNYERALELLLHPATVKPLPWQHTMILQAFISQGEHRLALRYIHTMKPTMSTDGDVCLHLTILIYNRCVVEACSLLRQHSNSLNRKDLLKHTYDMCQEMGLLEDFLKIPLTDTEQECLVRILQNTNSVQNHKFLLLHHLQHANYISALKLNQTLQMNSKNNHNPLVQERSLVRNLMLAQCGKGVPKVEQKVTIERAKPYSRSTTILQEVATPKLLSAFPKPTLKRTVLSRSVSSNKVLSDLETVDTNSKPNTGISLCTSPKIKESSPAVSSLPISDASVGTPTEHKLVETQASQKSSKQMNMADCPVRQPSQCMRVFLQSPTKSPLDLPSYLLPVNSCVKRSWDHITKTKELHCLETPLMAKKAKSLATTATASGSVKSSPQSILKSCLPSTSLASSSLSPEPSLVPLQLKESKISLREEGITAKCTTGVAYDNKTNIYVTTPPHSILVKTESVKTRKKVSFSLDNQKNDDQELHVRLQDTSSHCLEKSDVRNGNNSASSILDQTSTEYHDAVSPKDFEGVFTPLKTENSSTELIADVTEKTQDGNSNMVESEGSPPKMPRLSDTENTEDILGVSKCASFDKGLSQNQQTPQKSVIVRRGRRRLMSPNTSESSNATHLESLIISGRESKESKSSLPLESTIQTSFRKEGENRSSKGIKKPTENQGNSEGINDANVNKATSPRRSTRRVSSAKLEAAENAKCKHGLKSSEQQLFTRHSKMMKVPKISGTVAGEDSKAESSLTTLQAKVSMCDTPRKRGRPRKINTDDITPTAHMEERSPKRRKDLSIQRRTRGNTSATTKNTHAGKGAPEKSVSVPNAERETVLSPK